MKKEERQRAREYKRYMTTVVQKEKKRLKGSQDREWVY